MKSEGDNGLPMSISAMREFCENPPVGAEQTVGGVKPVKRMKALMQRAEEAERQKMLDRYNGLHTSTTDKVEDADETLDLVEERIDGWLKQMKAGRLDPDKVIDNVRLLPEVLTAIAETYDAAKDDAEAAYAFIDQDPADFQADQLKRFPALEKSLPMVTEGFLRGASDAPDPLAPPVEPDSRDARTVGAFMDAGRFRVQPHDDEAE
jgi:hypothetical protein